MDGAVAGDHGPSTRYRGYLDAADNGGGLHLTWRRGFALDPAMSSHVQRAGRNPGCASRFCCAGGSLPQLGFPAAACASGISGQQPDFVRVHGRIHLTRTHRRRIVGAPRTDGHLLRPDAMHPAVLRSEFGSDSGSVERGSVEPGSVEPAP